MNKLGERGERWIRIKKIKPWWTDFHDYTKIKNEGIAWKERYIERKLHGKKVTIRA